MTKSIFIIDSLNTALIAAILFKNKKLDVCIIESKSDIFDGVMQTFKLDVETVLNIILSEIDIGRVYRLNIDNITLDNPRLGSTWLKFFHINHKVKTFLDNLVDDYEKVEFYGAITSTIIHFLPDNTQIHPVDHGVECLGRKEKIFRYRQRKKILKAMLYFFTGYKNLALRNLKCGYTLAVCKDDYYTHLNYEEFSNKFFDDFFKKNCNVLCKGANMLYLAPCQTIYEIKAKALGLKENSKQIDFEKYHREIFNEWKNIQCVVVKFHPTVYLYSKNILNKELKKIKDICSKVGKECVHIDEIAEFPYLHAVPAEILVKYFKFSHVVGFDSAALLNLATKNSSQKCINYSNAFQCDEYENIVELYEMANDNIEVIHL